MNRRRFLGTMMLGGAAVFGVASAARAFSQQSCGDTASVAACDEVARHKQLLIELKQQIETLHLSPEQEQAALARAVCPFCGAPLIG